MTSNLHSHGIVDNFGYGEDHGGWSGEWGRGYDYEEEFVDQLTRLPSIDEVEEIMSNLRVVVLRELASDILKDGISHVKGDIERIDFVRSLNSWFATAEESVAAGARTNRIVARRKRTS